METKKEEPKKVIRPASFLWVFFIGIAILFFLIGGIKSYNNSEKNNNKKQNDSGRVEDKTIINNKKSELPAKYNEYHLLKKGEVVRVTIPTGYDCNFYGGGKKYYNQPQNGTKEIWGSNSPVKKCQNGSYSDLSYYDEEIIVRCEFIKIE